MNKPQPFSGLCAEALEIELIKLMRVNRDDELKQCIDALFGRSENLLLYGSRGVGKTFLVRLLLEEIKSHFDDTVPTFVNMTGLLAYEPAGVISAFPNAVLLELCRTIWVDVMGKEYSTLRGVLSETGREIKLRKKGEKKVVEVYRLLMTSARRMKVSKEYSVGVSSAVLKGGTKGDTQSEWSEIDTLPFEFFEFVEEIKKETLRPNGKERIITICDEANKLPIFQQAEILERYLELFAARQVQFVFVAGYRPGEKVGHVPSGFQSIVELKGFQEKRHVKQLIDKHTTTISISFLDSAIGVVWDVFKGHPSHTIHACRYAYEQADRDRLERIDARVMAVACTRLLREQEEYRSMLESQSR